MILWICLPIGILICRFVPINACSLLLFEITLSCESITFYASIVVFDDLCFDEFVTSIKFLNMCSLDSTLLYFDEL